MVEIFCNLVRGLFFLIFNVDNVAIGVMQMYARTNSTKIIEPIQHEIQQLPLSQLIKKAKRPASKVFKRTKTFPITTKH